MENLGNLKFTICVGPVWAAEPRRSFFVFCPAVYLQEGELWTRG